MRVSKYTPITNTHANVILYEFPFKVEKKNKEAVKFLLRRKSAHVLK